jgi:hypothetical protein
MWWAPLLNNIVALLGDGGGAANSYESIATVTVGAGGSSTISFSSIPSTYKHLQIRLIGRTNVASTNGGVRIAMNSDATAANYRSHYLQGNGSTVSAGTSAGSTSGIQDMASITGNNATANNFGAAVIDILDYTNTNKYKTVRSLSGQDNNGNGATTFASGLWLSTSAINALTLEGNGSNFVQYTTAALYGVKG